MSYTKDFYDDVPISVWEKILDSTMSYHWASSDGPASVFENPVLSLLPHIGNAKKILDVGCGFGAVAKVLLNNLEDLEITGVTNSQVQYDYLVENPIENFNVVFADAEDWSSAEKYDLILFFESFTHFGDDILEKFKDNADVVIVKDYIWDERYYSPHWGMHFREVGDFEEIFGAAGFLISDMSQTNEDFWELAGAFWKGNILNNLTEEEKISPQIHFIRELIDSGESNGNLKARLITFKAIRSQ